MASDRLGADYSSLVAPASGLTLPNQHRPVGFDGTAVAPQNFGGGIASRLYVRQWGATEVLKNVATDCKMIAIGTSSHHDSVLVKSADSDRFIRVATAAPAIYDFKQPIQVVPIAAVDSPLELMFYSHIPDSIQIKRAPVRRQWQNGKLYGTKDESPLGISQIFIGGRRRWKLAIFNNGGALTINFQFGLYVVQEVGFNPFSLSLYPQVPVTSQSIGSLAGAYITSDDIFNNILESNADVMAIIDAATGNPWLVTGLTSSLILETED